MYVECHDLLIVLAQSDLFGIQARMEQRPTVLITPLSALPGHHTVSYCGRIELHLIRENTTIRETGGASMFAGRALEEAAAMARAHTIAMGGNAVVGFKVKNFVMRDSPQRNSVRLNYVLC